METLLLTFDDTGHAISVGRTSIYGLVKAGHLKAVKIGRRSLITAESLRAYVDSLTTESTLSDGGEAA